MAVVGERLTQVLNPAVSRSTLYGTDIDQVETALAQQDTTGDTVSYDAEIEPESNRYDAMQMDTEKGIMRVQDAAYDGAREMVALAFESETDTGEMRDGVLAVDSNGASARVYSDGTAEYNGVDGDVMDTVQRLATDMWGYLACEEQRDAGGAVLEDKPYTVELQDAVEKQREKLDGTQQEMFDKTLVDLAEAPYDFARDVTDGGRSVYHAVSSDDRVLARVDDESSTVTVYWFGDHDEMDRQRGRIH